VGLSGLERLLVSTSRVVRFRFGVFNFPITRLLNYPICFRSVSDQRSSAGKLFPISAMPRDDGDLGGFHYASHCHSIQMILSTPIAAFLPMIRVPSRQSLLPRFLVIL